MKVRGRRGGAVMKEDGRKVGERMEKTPLATRNTDHNYT